MFEWWFPIIVALTAIGTLAYVAYHLVVDVLEWDHVYGFIAGAMVVILPVILS